MGYFIGFIIWGVIWGVATNSVIKNKGYDENWFWWGFLFGFIAFIVALTKPENRSYHSYDSYSIGSSSSFDRSSYDVGRHTSNANSSLFGDRTQEVLRQSDWKCDCGRINAAYIGTCVCGRQKSDVEAKRLQAAQGQTKIDETSTLAALKEYKKLLDEGVLTQEEFDAKKKSLLGA